MLQWLVPLIGASLQMPHWCDIWAHAYVLVCLYVCIKWHYVYYHNPLSVSNVNFFCIISECWLTSTEQSLNELETKSLSPQWLWQGWRPLMDLQWLERWATVWYQRQQECFLLLQRIREAQRLQWSFARGSIIGRQLQTLDWQLVRHLSAVMRHWVTVHVYSLIFCWAHGVLDQSAVCVYDFVCVWHCVCICFRLSPQWVL